MRLAELNEVCRRYLLGSGKFLQRTLVESSFRAEATTERGSRKANDEGKRARNEGEHRSACSRRTGGTMSVRTA